MTSAARARAVARPRQVAMYLAKQLTPARCREIGSKFGGRDHTTVMHAVRKIEELKSADPALAEDVERSSADAAGLSPAPVREAASGPREGPVSHWLGA